jgi:L-iditol 2-dehydrogenase
LVLGSGPVGLSAIIFASMRGALRVLCIGAPEQRLEAARKLGAVSLNFETSDERTREQWVLDRTEGRGADVTIEATGAPVAVVQAMRYTRDAGRVCVVGQYTDHGEVSLNPHHDLNRKHLTVRGCWGSDFSHFYRGVQIMADPVRSEPWSLLKLDRYGLGEANEALADVAAGKVTKAIIAPTA